MVKRKLAAHDNLKITIQQDGSTFHIKESSNFRNLEMDFTLGVTFDYSLADGTELSVSTTAPRLFYHGETVPRLSRCRDRGAWRERR